VGVVGDDEAAGALLTAELRRAASPRPRHRPDRRTTTKMRVVTTRNQQVARIDYETTGDLDRRSEDALMAWSTSTSTRDACCWSRTTRRAWSRAG
jgi:bifunctional ADP-heptose synthase (sugar kinase/adenylyltransferase)